MDIVWSALGIVLFSIPCGLVVVFDRLDRQRPTGRRNP
jgi:hypothetical protein